MKGLVCLLILAIILAIGPTVLGILVCILRIIAS